MASPQDNISMALFCDFENVALGVRDAQYDKFDIKRVLERLLLKGSIVVKKAYCDWDRYKTFKGTMHEANFELIEIPHVRQSGKNSADIRLVVDALDLCYTKSHVNTFVIISGDSDFSPLVSKLRENAKHVIGVGVKQSTSDLLIANCDEFIFYDDLVREGQRQAARRDNRDAQPSRRSPEDERRRREELDARRTKGVELAVTTYEALVTDRDDGGKMWASVLKEALKRRNPGFNESYYGFKTFGNLLEEAQARGLLEFGRDEKSGAYVARGSGPVARADGTTRADPAPAPAPLEVQIAPAPSPAPDASEGASRQPRARGSRGSRGGRGHATQAEAAAGRRTTDDRDSAPAPALMTPPPDAPTATAPAGPAAVPAAVPAAEPPTPAETEAPAPRRSTRGGSRKTPARKAADQPTRIEAAAPAPTDAPSPVPAPANGSPESGEAAKKTASRARRPRKTAAKTAEG